MARAVGIDLGTTNSVVSVLEGGEPTVIANAEGSRTTPSIVAFARNGEVLVGEVAKRQAVTNPDRTIRSVKREMGTGWSIDIDGKKYTPQEISARVLMKLKRDAEAYLGETITDAVITVPAYFNDAQRQATKEAGEIAGFNVLRIVNEPTAAALAYGLDKEGADQTILVFDLGGGTFDVSVLELGDGVFEVKSTNGDNHLGGDNFDKAIVDWMTAEFKKDQGIDLAADPMALQRLYEAAEKAKIELSNAMETTVNLPFITADQNGPKHLQMTITRTKFEQLINELVEKTRQPVTDALKDAGLSASQIDEVVLVGGSTRVPMVQKLVKELFGGKEPNKTVNPDEVVAVGAAIQGAIATGAVKDILVLDATPLSLGVETLGGVMTPLIQRNTTIPTSKKEVFSTASDNQAAVTINVLQGEREFAKDNRLLGTFNLEGIAPAPRGMPQIEVTFNVDVNGILTVAAKDLGTNKENKITVQNAGGLSKDEIDKMKRDAEAHAADDKKRREVIDLKNQGEAMAYQTEKQLREHGEKVSGEIRGNIESALNALRDALKSDDGDRIKKAMENLTTVSHKLAEEMYKSSAPGGGTSVPPEAQTDRGTTEGAASGDGKKKDDDVIDAEYEVKE